MILKLAIVMVVEEIEEKNLETWNTWSMEKKYWSY